MKIKVISILPLLLLDFGLNFAQELRVNFYFADSIKKVNRDLGSELHAILLYNEAVKSFEYSDTIKITLSGGNFKYFYKDSLITDLRYKVSNKQKLVMLDYSGPTSTYLIASTQQSLTNKFEMFVSDAAFDKNDLVYRLSNYFNDVLIGRYEERTRSGKVLITGQYCQIDSIYADTILTFDPETYEDINTVFPRTKFAIKTGIWYYYSSEGILTKEEKHKKCT